MSEEMRDLRNQIFAASQAVGLTPQEKQAAQMHNMLPDDELADDLPVESAPLPSMGLVYSADHPLHKKETVDIKPMTIRELDMLSNRAFHKKGGSFLIKSLVKSCLIDKSVDVGTLVQGDLYSILMSIVIISYGADYNVKVECPKCEEGFDNEFDLSQLELERLKISPVSAGQNLFEFVLPSSKKRVTFKLLTEADTEELAANEEVAKKKLGFSSSISSSLMRSIVAVDGVGDRGKISRFVSSMRARDVSALSKYVSENEPGVNMKQKATCPSCESESEVQVPITSTFLFR